MKDLNDLYTDVQEHKLLLPDFSILDMNSQSGWCTRHGELGRRAWALYQNRREHRDYTTALGAYKLAMDLEYYPPMADWIKKFYRINPEVAYEKYAERFARLDPETLYDHFLMHHLGLNAPENQELAMAALKKSADDGYTPAMILLGYHYMQDYEVPENSAKAEAYCSAAADNNVNLALLVMYSLYFYQQKPEANEFLARACQNGSIIALHFTGEDSWEPLNQQIAENRRLINDVNIRHQADIAVNYMELASFAEHALAKYRLGRIYLDGNDIQIRIRPRNQLLGRQYLFAAANMGLWIAQYDLGDILYHGLYGATMDLSGAFHYYQLAAAHNIPGAIYQLGNMCMRGIGIGTHYERAKEYFRRAIELNGHAEARFNLASLYRNPKITSEPRQREAIQLYRQAAENGHRKSEEELSNLTTYNLNDHKYEHQIASRYHLNMVAETANIFDIAELILNNPETVPELIWDLTRTITYEQPEIYQKITDIITRMTPHPDTDVTSQFTINSAETISSYRMLGYIYNKWLSLITHYTPLRLLKVSPATSAIFRARLYTDIPRILNNIHPEYLNTASLMQLISTLYLLLQNGQINMQSAYPIIHKLVYSIKMHNLDAEITDDCLCKLAEIIIWALPLEQRSNHEVKRIHGFNDLFNIFALANQQNPVLVKHLPVLEDKTLIYDISTDFIQTMHKALFKTPCKKSWPQTGNKFYKEASLALKKMEYIWMKQLTAPRALQLTTDEEKEFAHNCLYPAYMQDRLAPVYVKWFVLLTRYMHETAVDAPEERVYPYLGRDLGDLVNKIPVHSLDEHTIIPFFENLITALELASDFNFGTDHEMQLFFGAAAPALQTACLRLKQLHLDNYITPGIINLIFLRIIPQFFNMKLYFSTHKMNFPLDAYATLDDIIAFYACTECLPYYENLENIMEIINNEENLAIVPCENRVVASPLLTTRKEIPPSSTNVFARMFNNMRINANIPEPIKNSNQPFTRNP